MIEDKEGADANSCLKDKSFLGSGTDKVSNTLR